MNTLSLRRLLWRSMWGVMALVCGVFSLSAAEFYWVTVTQQTPSYASFLAWTVSDEFAFGTQSGFAQMTPYWRNMPAFNQVVLGSHAVLASLALVIGAVQFHPRIRMRWPSIHRWGGRVYASTTLVAMILAMVYLGLTPTEHIYGGAPFAAGLWGIAVLTTYTLLASWVHIVRGERVAHQTTMVLNFAAMLIAPLLRFWWMALGWMFEAEGWSQETAHVAVLMFLGLQVVVGAIAVLHLQRRNLTGQASGAIQRVRDWMLRHASHWERWLWLAFGGTAVSVTLQVSSLQNIQPEFVDTYGMYVALHGVGLCILAYWMPVWLRQTFILARSQNPFADGVFLAALGCVILGRCGQAFGWGDNGVRGVGTMAFLLALTGATVVFGLLWLDSIRCRDARAKREMVLHLYAMNLVPVSHSFCVPLFCWMGLSAEDAYLSAAVLLPPLHLSASFYYTVYSCRAVPETISPQSHRPRSRTLASV